MTLEVNASVPERLRPNGYAACARPTAAVTKSGRAFTMNPDGWLAGHAVIEPVGEDRVVLDMRPSRRASWPAGAAGTEAATTELGGFLMALGQQSPVVPLQCQWEVFADGRLHVTAITEVDGALPAWEEDIDSWQSIDFDPERVWTLNWAEESWNGATTPLHYSIVARELQEAHHLLRASLGDEDLQSERLFTYWRGRAYYNTHVDAVTVTRIAFRGQRPGMLGNVLPAQRQAVLDADLPLTDFLRVVARQVASEESGPRSWIRRSYGWMGEEADEENAGLGYTDLERLADRELVAYVDARVQRSSEFNAQMWLGFYTYGSWGMQALTWILKHWASGACEDGVGATLQVLCSGLPLPAGIQARERQELWMLGEAVRASPDLWDALWAAPELMSAEGGLRDTDGGPRFSQMYLNFLARYGDRGGQDRDIYYDRRSEDPRIDLLGLSVLLKSDEGWSPEDLRDLARVRRESQTGRIVAELAAQPFGALRIEMFRWLLGYVHDFLQLREDQRHSYDILGQSKKRGLLTVARRLVRLGILDSTEDSFFLTFAELGSLLCGCDSADVTLARAKVRGRRAQFDAVLAGEASLPPYMRDRCPYDTGVSPPDSGGTQWSGVGTSSGVVEGVARIVQSLSDIDKVGPGEVLVCSHLDPGWWPVCMVAAGLVMENGRMLSTGACLARELAMPAVTLEAARGRIADGARIRVDGSTGEVRILSR